MFTGIVTLNGPALGIVDSVAINHPPAISRGQNGILEPVATGLEPVANWPQLATHRPRKSLWGRPPGLRSTAGRPRESEPTRPSACRPGGPPDNALR